MTAEKIRGLSQNQIPIEKRRALYNSMGRRVTAAVGLKPGLVEKYNAVASCRKERWNMLKEFIIDQDMFLPEWSGTVFALVCSTAD